MFALKTRSKQQGYSLVEVLIGILILTVGILGMATMQLSAKRIGFDALQRSIATSLAHDIIERIRSNPKAVPAYIVNNLGAGSSEPSPNCYSADCSATQLAAHDLWEWEQALIGASEKMGTSSVGGLVNPRACITHFNGLITVTIVWKGFQAIGSPSAITCGSGLNLYGALDAERQHVFFTTVVLR
jgi:type IV pilus assembly protein PilV